MGFAEEEKKLIKEMEENGEIRKSSYPWSSPLCLVFNKNGPTTSASPSTTWTVAASNKSANSSGMTPDPYMATEPLEVAMVSLDDFLSSNPNFNFLDRILGYDSPENNISTVPTASQEKDHPADSSGKNDDQGKENKRESKRKRK